MVLMMIRSNLKAKWFFCVLPPECLGEMNMLRYGIGVGKGVSLLESRIRNISVQTGKCP